jgi:hypothetical protein
MTLRRAAGIRFFFIRNRFQTFTVCRYPASGVIAKAGVAIDNAKATDPAAETKERTFFLSGLFMIFPLFTGDSTFATSYQKNIHYCLVKDTS